VTPATQDLSFSINGDLIYQYVAETPPANGAPVTASNPGTPINLPLLYTSAKCQVRQSQLQTSALIFTFSSTPAAGQGTITFNSSGQIVLSANHTILSGLAPGVYWYDVLLENLTASPPVSDCYVEGPITLKSGVTVP
jgi:hypothetical protein